jgi:hypothetical protein
MCLGLDSSLLMTLHENKTLQVFDVERCFELLGTTQNKYIHKQIISSENSYYISFISQWKKATKVDNLHELLKSICFQTKRQFILKKLDKFSQQPDLPILKTKTKELSTSMLSSLSNLKTKTSRLTEKSFLKPSLSLQDNLSYNYRRVQPISKTKIEDVILENYLGKPDLLIKDIQRLRSSNTNLSTVLYRMLYQNVNPLLDSVWSETTEKPTRTPTVNKDNFREIYFELTRQ